MSESFKKQDLIDYLQHQFKDQNFTDDFFKKFIDDIFDTVSYEAVNASSVMIPNFGKFILKEYGQEKAKKLDFLPSRSLKEKLNQDSDS
jgi:nucleoid DNA-binding protein